MRFILRDRRSIWWGWRVMSVAPRIVNEVSFVMRINHEIHFAWQAQHLVKFMCHSSWQAQHVVKFGMIAGAGNVVIFNRICSGRVRKVALPARRVQFCVFRVGSFSDHGRIMLGSVAHWKWRFTCFQPISVRCWVVILRGRRSIWWGWKVMPVAPRIVNDVSYVMRINHEIHFAWQAQYLVRLEGDACCSAHCKWRFICDVDQSWDSFCVAGAVFGEVEGCWLLLRAL